MSRQHVAPRAKPEMLIKEYPYEFPLDFLKIKIYLTVE